MALLPFKKLTLIAHSRDEEAILTLLSRSGSAEIIRTSEIEHCTRGDASARVETVSAELAEISFCLDFWRAEKVKLEKVLKKQAKEQTTLTTYSPNKVSLLEKIRGGKPEIAFDEFDRIGADHEDLKRVEERLREISAKETELKGEASRLTSLAEQLSYYKNCDLSFDTFKTGRYLETMIGLVPADQLAASDFTDLTLYTQEIDNRQRFATLFVAYPTAEREAVLDRLSAVGFSRCAFDFPMTATEKLAEIAARTHM